MDEEWRPVVGYEGLYEVSDHGRIKSLPRVIARGRGHTNKIKFPGCIMKPEDNHRGTGGSRLSVRLSRDGRYRKWGVHQLVLQAFIGPCPDGLVCCHNDGDYRNNHVENLRWDTQSSNILDAVAHGTHTLAGMTRCLKGLHEFTPENTIRDKNGRRCRECRNASARASWNARVAATRAAS